MSVGCEMILASSVYSLINGKEKCQCTVAVYGLTFHFLSPRHCYAQDLGSDKRSWKM